MLTSFSSNIIELFPADPAYYGVLHLMFELAYEFFKGVKLTTESRLEPCEAIVSDFFETTDKIMVLWMNGDNDDDLEAFFQTLDSFIYFTPIIYQCYISGTYMLYTAQTDVVYNTVEKPENLLFNTAHDMFYPAQHQF